MLLKEQGLLLPISRCAKPQPQARSKSVSSSTSSAPAAPPRSPSKQQQQLSAAALVGQAVATPVGASSPLRGDSPALASLQAAPPVTVESVVEANSDGVFHALETVNGGSEVFVDVPTDVEDIYRHLETIEQQQTQVV